MNILMDFLSMVFGFMIFICCFFEMKSIIYIKNKVKNNIFRDFEPIVDINISRSRCLTEKGYYPILNYTFKGVDENCYDVDNNKFLNHSCSNSENFSTVNQINENTINIWRERNVCAKKAKNKTDGYEFHIGNYKSLPPDGYKNCGVINNFDNSDLTSDVIKKQVFGKKEKECPINSINIYKLNNSNNNINNINEKLFFADNYILNFTNQNDSGNVLTDLKISEDFPCLEIERKSNKTSQFPMLNDIKFFNCTREIDTYYDEDSESIVTEFDERFVELDNISKYQLFKDNGMDILYNNLPNVSNWTNDLHNSSFSLFYRSFYINKENYSDYHDSINKLFNLHYSRLCINLGNLLILIFFIVILGLMKFVLAICHTLIFSLKLVILFFIFFANIIIIGQSKNLFDDVKIFFNRSTLFLKFDRSSKHLIYRYNIFKMMDSYDIIIKYEIVFWWCFFSFNFIQAFRLGRKIYIRIKNKKRRKIVKEEIGKITLKNIMKEFREKQKNKKKQKFLDKSDFL